MLQVVFVLVRTRVSARRGMPAANRRKAPTPAPRYRIGTSGAGDRRTEPPLIQLYPTRIHYSGEKVAWLAIDARATSAGPGRTHARGGTSGLGRRGPTGWVLALTGAAVR
jgi:hypothetical protein